jgi:hypothetical protein
MKLYELGTVFHQLNYLFDLLETTLVAVFNIWDKELEEVLAHFVFDDG